MPAPVAGEVRVGIRATAVSSSDCFTRALSLQMPTRLLARLALGIKRPRRSILGMALAGEVDATGPGVQRLRVGDEVFGFTGTRFGTYAEFVCVAEHPGGGMPGTVRSVIGPRPANLSFEEAAALPHGALLALHFLEKGRLQRGERALIYGASGAVGTFAVQLARHFGAHVTAVCGPTNTGLVKTLGADAVLDYRSDDLATQGARFDFIFDAVGKLATWSSRPREALSAQGRIVTVNDGTPQFTATQLSTVRQLAEARALRPAIDRTFSLEQLVDAHRYVDQGHKKGNVVITVG